MEDQALLDYARGAALLAYPWRSGTRVGCAIESALGFVAEGFNIEGLWQTSIHAEVCAITQLVPEYPEDIGVKVAIVAEAELFTPCGACIDWLRQFCEEDAPIIVQSKDGTVRRFILRDLMPHYPKQ